MCFLSTLLKSMTSDQFWREKKTHLAASWRLIHMNWEVMFFSLDCIQWWWWWDISTQRSTKSKTILSLKTHCTFFTPQKRRLLQGVWYQTSFHIKRVFAKYYLLENYYTLLSRMNSRLYVYYAPLSSWHNVHKDYYYHHGIQLTFESLSSPLRIDGETALKKVLQCNLTDFVSWLANRWLAFTWTFSCREFLLLHHHEVMIQWMIHTWLSDPYETLRSLPFISLFSRSRVPFYGQQNQSMSIEERLPFIIVYCDASALQE